MSHYDSPENTPQHELLSMVQSAASGKLTRRGFVTLAAAIGAGQLAASQLGPLRRAFGAAAPRPAVPTGSAGAGNLVVVFLGGGNDGLNTLVPVMDAEYNRVRPTIKLMATEVLSLGAGVQLGLHPSLKNVQRRYLAGQVALVQGVGYNAPDLSHFNSLDHWEAGYGAPGSALVPTQTGWLGRWLDSTGAGPFGGVSFRADDKMVLGAKTDAIRLRVWEGNLLGGPTDGPMDVLALDALRALTGRTGLGAFADDLGSVLGSAISAGGQVGPALKVSGVPSSFGRQMVASANLLNAGIGTRVITTVHGGFDTHNEQAIRQAFDSKDPRKHPFGWHGKLLSDLDSALELLFTTMTPAVRANTTVLVYSEFGRRVAENGSYGTDHGQAGLAMVLGEGVNGGIFGEPPSLLDLEDGNMKMNVDFRSVYATLLSRFLGADDAAIIGAAHQRLLLSKADAEATTPTTSTSTSTTSSTTTSTVAPTTGATTVVTTVASTTPTTAVPTTAVPTTAAPTTGGPTSVAPLDPTIASTAAPTTAAPTTAAPTTAAPTTAAPTTMIAPTTLAPSTSATTVKPSSTTSSTLGPTSSVPKFDPPVLVPPSPAPGFPADPNPTPTALPVTPPLSRTDPVATEPSPSPVPFDSPIVESPLPPASLAPVAPPVVAPVVTSPSTVRRPTTTLPKRLALKPKAKSKRKAAPKPTTTQPVKKLKKTAKAKSPSVIARGITQKR
jgi:uncharacterized protein (DUF1501 family)